MTECHLLFTCSLVECSFFVAFQFIFSLLSAFIYKNYWSWKTKTKTTLNTLFLYFFNWILITTLLLLALFTCHSTLQFLGGKPLQRMSHAIIFWLCFVVYFIVLFWVTFEPEWNPPRFIGCTLFPPLWSSSTPPGMWRFDQHTAHILPNIISLPSLVFSLLLAAAGKPSFTHNSLHQVRADKIQRFKIQLFTCRVSFQS